MSNGSKALYEFGEFQLDPVRRLLWRGGEVVPLKLKAVETLILLVERHGEVTTKAEIFARVWPELIVEEAVLTNSIYQLRQALGLQTDGSDHIKTIPKRGYQFTAPVNEIIKTSQETPPEILPETSLKAGPVVYEERKVIATQSEEIAELVLPDENLPASTQAIKQIVSPATVWQVAWRRYRWVFLSLPMLVGIALVGYFFQQRASQSVRTLAILPFKPMAPQTSEPNLGVGLADALILRSSRLGLITVRPTSAVYRYAESTLDSISIGKELQVDAVMEGFIQHIDDRIRVTAQLLEVSTGKSLMTVTVDDQWKNILKLQDTLAERMVTSLAVKLTPIQQAHLLKHDTENPEALRLYQLGRYFSNQRSEEQLRKAIGYYEAALQVDAQYARAYAGIADAYSLMNDQTSVSAHEVCPKALDAARRALGLDDSLAEAHTSLAYILATYEWKWQEAEIEHRRAIELDPHSPAGHYWYGNYLSSQGRHEEAIAETTRAAELDPTSKFINAGLVLVWYYARNYEQAINKGKEIIDVVKDYEPYYQYLYLAYYQKGDSPNAIAAFLTSRKLRGESSNEINIWRQTYLDRGWNGIFEKQLKGIQYGKPSDIAYRMGILYALLQQNDLAFTWFEKAYLEHARGMMQLKVNPRLDPLRSDHRFEELLGKVGL